MTGAAAAAGGSAYLDLQRRFYRCRRRLYLRRPWPGWVPRLPWDRYDDLWPFANAWAATAAIAALAPTAPAGEVDLSARLEGLLRYHRGDVWDSQGPISFESSPVPPDGGGGDVYYDDNAWIALDLLHQHRLTGDERCVRLAGRILDFLVAGWSDDPGRAVPGGIRWAVPAWSTSRNTCVHGPTAQVGALLSAVTADPGPLEWARRIYAWTSAALGRDDGLYADRLEPDGSVVDTPWSYNQGTMIGAGMLLHRATGEEGYRRAARRTAAAAASRFSSAESLAAEGPAFSAILLRNLLFADLGSAVTRPVVEAAASFADHAERSGAGGHPRVNDRAGIVALRALVAGSPPHP